ncbi:hypothetical protein [Hymenobacter guriensis]|uniref:STAS/SEC14 domain-containing protein n=1 Tax=Hymenobacter guriensis TaxID=2793065 RepID=A0ABS0L1T9_9BACT|nr:hypothetical protein [Hymenobacter guriensis]MBG8554075.1 hypothetical protein [Hymenobacter guriensis]
MQPALSFPYLNIYLHTAACPAIELQWLSFANSTSFRQSVSQGLQLALEHRVQGWIADDRLLGPVRPKDLDWVHRTVLLPLSRMGLRRFALLASDDPLNRLTIDRMYEQAETDIAFELRRFDEIEEARRWICD